MPPDEETRIETRLQAIEASQTTQNATLAQVVGNLELLSQALLGPRDGSRAGFAERVRDHDTRIATLECRTDEHARQLGIFECRPNMSIQREVATHAGAGGAGAFLVVVLQFVLERLT